MTGGGGAAWRGRASALKFISAGDKALTGVYVNDRPTDSSPSRRKQQSGINGKHVDGNDGELHRSPQLGRIIIEDCLLFDVVNIWNVPHNGIIRQKGCDWRGDCIYTAAMRTFSHPLGRG